MKTDRYKQRDLAGEWDIIDEFPVINLNNAGRRLKSLGLIHEDILEVECTNCHVHTFVKKGIFYQYCPHCGADMSFVFDPWSKDIIQETMCDSFCKYPEQWDAKKEGCELEESDHCKKCPLNHIRQ